VVKTLLATIAEPEGPENGPQWEPEMGFLTCSGSPQVKAAPAQDKGHNWKGGGGGNIDSDYVGSDNDFSAAALPDR
jgi:hypothetical protein